MSSILLLGNEHQCLYREWCWEAASAGATKFQKQLWTLSILWEGILAGYLENNSPATKPPVSNTKAHAVFVLCKCSCSCDWSCWFSEKPPADRRPLDSWTMNHGCNFMRIDVV